MQVRKNCAIRRWTLASIFLINLIPQAHGQTTQPIPGIELLPQPITVAPGIELLARVTDPNLINTTAVAFDVNQTETTNTNVIQATPYNLTGAGITVGEFDPSGYVLDTHQELAGRVTFGDDEGAPYSDHATHVAGIIGASGVNPDAIGMATQVNIRSYIADQDTDKMAADANILALTNHSYGFLRGWTVLNWGDGPERTWFADRSQYSVEDPSFGKYDNYANELDTVLHANPRLLSIWSAGNDRLESGDFYSTYTPDGPNTYVTYLSFGDQGLGFYRVTTDDYSLPPADGNGGTGYDSLAQMQVAKNNLVVGAINPITAANPTATMTNFSSWGPTDDGRMKPDVVADGVNVLSATAQSNSSYLTASGTSAAAPNVTGTMALVIQHLMQVRNTTQFPLSATSKAIAIHTAHDILNPGPDYQSGYGVLDGEAAIKFIDGTTAANPTDHIIESTYTDTAYHQDFNAVGGEVKATLVWNDPAAPDAPQGLDDPTLALINDLDVWITDDLNNTYYPWTLDPANPNALAVRDQRNFRDNVEQVLIDDLPAGMMFTVHVDLSGELTGDSQDFSLLLSGGALIPEPNLLALCLPLVIVAVRRRRTKLGNNLSLELSEG